MVYRVVMTGKVAAISTSVEKGTKKKPVLRADLIVNHGIKGDAHAGEKIRQISLLALESIEKMKAKCLKVSAGDFAENITTLGINLLVLKIGDKLKIGNNVLVEITQIGKECHDRCEIYRQLGDCVMPREGVFARVLRGGKIKTGDNIKIFLP